MTSPLWHADAGLIRLKTPRMSAVVDLAKPAAGLHDIAIDGAPIGEVQLLGVEIAPPAAASPDKSIEHFLRGGDLAATYADQPQPQARTQVYWRALADTDALGLFELLVSVQTNLLDGRPRLVSRSRLPAENAWRLDDAARGAFVEATARAESRVDSAGCLFRLNSGLSYAQFVHPADSQATRLVQANGEASTFELTHELFSDHLEKGVILRARILGVLLERANDFAAAAHHFAKFLAADLPLTT